jgi:hypothetical protein
MDWVLSATTYLTNMGLGWTKGASRMWLLHAINAAIWILYAIHIQQYGLIVLSIITIGTDLVSAYKMRNKNEILKNSSI